VRLAPGTDLRHAAGFGVAYGTSYHALRSYARLMPGETLVVLGAAGGVGSAAVMLGAQMGARVIAAASGPEKLAACRGWGAAEGIDYTHEDLKARIRELTGGRGADVVLDPVGGPYAEPALRALAWRGRYLVVGFAAGQIPSIPLNLVLLKSAAVLGFEIGSFLSRAPEEARRNTEELWAMFASGRLQPHIAAVYPLREVARALSDVAERRALGRVVIDLTA
jgi:NADPH2:quinone reductase